MYSIKSGLNACLLCVNQQKSLSNSFSKACNCQMAEESDVILFHMHGGGFVSQTSKSHQSYLKV